MSDITGKIIIRKISNWLWTNRSIFVCGIVLAIVLHGSSLVAQTADGAVTGTITDSSGGVVSGAGVDLTNTETTVSNHTVTNSEGIYRFSQVAPGHYRLSLHKDGYSAVTTNVQVTVTQTVKFDAVLSVGRLTEQVVVSTGPTALDSQSPTLGSVIERNQMEALPLNGQNPFALANLDPGVTSFGGFGGGISNSREALLAAGSNDFQANGGLTGYNEILLDGIAITVCCQGQPALLPTTDIIDQFKVQTGVPPANFGRTSGGVLNFTTKSGTSHIHGDVFEYNGNTILNAAQFFTKRAGKPPIPGRSDYRLPYNFNQFGGTIGGPLNLSNRLLGHNRTFFFFGFESGQSANASNSLTTVPTALQRQGIFSEAPSQIYDPSSVMTNPANPNQHIRTPFKDNTIPSGRLNPIALAYLKLFPMPNLPGTVNNLDTMSKSYDTDWQFSLRIDRHFSDRLASYLRVTDGTSFDARSGSISPDFSNIDAQSQRIRSAVISEGNSYTLSPNTLIEFHYGFAWQRNVNPGAALNFNPVDFGFPQEFAAVQERMALPTQSISGYASLGSQGGLLLDHYTHNLGVSVITQLGKHTLTYGYDGRLLYNMIGTNANPGGKFGYSSTFTVGPYTTSSPASGQSQFDSMAAFLLGLPISGSITQTATYAERQPYNAFYLQDDWRVTPAFTLNLGLRNEIEGGPTERHNKLSVLDPSATNPLSALTKLPFAGALRFAGVDGQPRANWKTAFSEFGPRAGFEYQFGPSTVFRGGYGLLWLPSTQRLLNGGNPAYSVTTPFLATVNGYTPVGSLSDPFPTGIQYPLGSTAGPGGLAGTSITSLVYDTDPSYVQQYTFGVEQNLGRSTIVKLTYVGTHGVKLPVSLFPNNLNPKYFGTPGDQAQVAFLQSTVANPFAPYVTSGTLSSTKISNQQLLARYPQYSSVGLQAQAIGSNHYNALQASIVQRLHGLTLTAAYTWAKTLGITNNDITDGTDGIGSPGFQNSYVLSIEKSINTTDIPQRFVASAIYQLPFGRGERFLSGAAPWLNQIIGGWKLTGIETAESGLPLNITNTGAPPFAGLRPNYVPGQPHATTGAIIDRIGSGGAKRYLNSAAFAYPLSFQFGDVPRLVGDVRAPGVLNTDASGLKDFTISENMRLQLSAEAFNLFNYVQFGKPGTSYGSSTFGVISGQANSPRQIQFGLKLFY